jgi:hypothetical protein
VSLYRFVRTSALLAVAGRYRSKLFRIAAAVAVALVTAWLFDDVALYLENHQPEWLGAALVIKTLIVYGALVYCFWQLRPGSWEEAKADAIVAKPSNRSGPGVGANRAGSAPQTPGPLDELMDKPRLRSRKDAILEGVDEKKS